MSGNVEREKLLIIIYWSRVREIFIYRKTSGLRYAYYTRINRWKLYFEFIVSIVFPMMREF